DGRIRAARSSARRSAAARKREQNDRDRAEARFFRRSGAPSRRLGGVGGRGRRPTAGALAACQCGASAPRVHGAILETCIARSTRAERARLALPVGTGALY